MSIIVDTGVVVALFSARDSYHRWATKTFSEVKTPLITCDAVITEAFHIIGDRKLAQLGLNTALSRGVVRSEFNSGEHIAPILELMRKYHDTPMDFADACLVRMAELHANCRVWTVDSDFLVYRRHGREEIPLIYPQ